MIFDVLMVIESPGGHPFHFHRRTPPFTFTFTGGHPLLAGCQLVELRLGRQWHLQDPQGRGDSNTKIMYLTFQLVLVDRY